MRGPRPSMGRVNRGYDSNGPGSFGYGRSGTVNEGQNYHILTSTINCCKYVRQYMLYSSISNVVAISLTQQLPHYHPIPRDRGGGHVHLLKYNQYTPTPFLALTLHNTNHHHNIRNDNVETCTEAVFS